MAAIQNAARIARLPSTRGMKSTEAVRNFSSTSCMVLLHSSEEHGGAGFLSRQSVRLKGGHDDGAHATSDLWSRVPTRKGRRDTLRFTALSRLRSSIFLITIAPAALAAAVRIVVNTAGWAATRSGLFTIRDNPSRTWRTLASRPRCGRVRLVASINPTGAATTAP